MRQHTTTKTLHSYMEREEKAYEGTKYSQINYNIQSNLKTKFIRKVIARNIS